MCFYDFFPTRESVFSTLADWLTRAAPFDWADSHFWGPFRPGPVGRPDSRALPCKQIICTDKLEMSLLPSLESSNSIKDW